MIDNNKVLIIAEAGVNHNGDVKIAKKLIDAAAHSGADYVKFQTWITEELIDINAPKAEYQKKNDSSLSQYDMLKKLELSFEDFRELKDYSVKTGVKFLSTPDDYPSLDFLSDELDLPLLKVGSGEITNIPFLKRIGSKKKNVILSTGMATLAEVEKAYNTLLTAGAKHISILHCTSNYPAAYSSVNLKAMLHLKDTFKTTVGYSDHTEGNEVSIAAVALGAQIIEKHFTLDRNLPGPDHKASSNPEELTLLVKQIRNVEASISGSGKKEPHDSETETKKVVTKGIYLRHSIMQGEIITEDSLAFKRPLAYIPASDYEKVLNKRVLRDINEGEPLNWSDFSIE